MLSFFLLTTSLERKMNKLRSNSFEEKNSEKTKYEFYSEAYYFVAALSLFE
jgi:hypothetical protein